MLSAVYYQHVSREINIHQNIWPQLRQKLYAVGASLLADADNQMKPTRINRSEITACFSHRLHSTVAAMTSKVSGKGDFDPV